MSAGSPGVADRQAISNESIPKQRSVSLKNTARRRDGEIVVGRAIAIRRRVQLLVRSSWRIIGVARSSARGQIRLQTIVLRPYRRTGRPNFAISAHPVSRGKIQPRNVLPAEIDYWERYQSYKHSLPLISPSTDILQPPTRLSLLIAVFLSLIVAPFSLFSLNPPKPADARREPPLEV